jgi:hypothetical protein
MVEIVSIAPAEHEAGLIGYECPRCGYVTRVVQPPLKKPTRARHDMPATNGTATDAQPAREREKVFRFENDSREPQPNLLAHLRNELPL